MAERARRTYYAVPACPAWLRDLDLDTVDVDVSDLLGNKAEEWSAQLDAAGVPSDRAGVLILNERRVRSLREARVENRRVDSLPLPSRAEMNAYDEQRWAIEVGRARRRRDTRSLLVSIAFFTALVVCALHFSGLAL